MNTKGKIWTLLSEIRTVSELVNKYKDYMYLLSDKEALENMPEDKANNLLKNLEKDYNDYFKI